MLYLIKPCIINPKKYEEGKLLERSAELSNVIYNQTDYLKDIKSATTKDEQDIVKQKILKSRLKQIKNKIT